MSLGRKAEWLEDREEGRTRDRKGMRKTQGVHYLELGNGSEDRLPNLLARPSRWQRLLVPCRAVEPWLPISTVAGALAKARRQKSGAEKK